MPYNTTAIPPRKEPTGQTQLPLSRVKKIISQDPDIHICSNNAAFVITLAAEMFVQHLADESHTQAKLERKPRRNIQYKDVANAISHQDNLEFLEDVVPKTVPYKKIKAAAGATQARLRGENNANERPPTAKTPVANGTSKSIVNGNSNGSPFAVTPRTEERQDDPNAQLELEMRQAAGQTRDGDVTMTG
ncbi:histone-fold-containing protein [Dactylonectria estremocensis]|uniref:Histone-fold-containing protein n=1 Tax=Dactylonectria estremocensis TaxID=1079267 RepID=A0A9P9FE99_9HYPO|nr:histone-fold-containing protein [Dactylonectria estremocensis]